MERLDEIDRELLRLANSTRLLLEERDTLRQQRAVYDVEFVQSVTASTE